MPDDWVWTLVDIECPSCGATNQLHEQRPDDLEAGVVWECRYCDAKHKLGGPPPGTGKAEVVVECPECHRTFLVLPGASVTCPDDGSELSAAAVADRAGTADTAGVKQ